MADQQSEDHSQVSLMKQVLAELKQQREKVQALREEVQGSSINISSEVSKQVNQKDIAWKYSDSKIQFEFNKELSDGLQQLVWPVDHSKTDYDKDMAEELKLIRLADTSPGSWETVRQYEVNPVASDSDDEAKITKAENRALIRKKIGARSGFRSRKLSDGPFEFGDGLASNNRSFGVQGHFFEAHSDSNNFRTRVTDAS